MKILVPIKRVPDYQAKVRVSSSGNSIDTDGIKWICNPFDEIAVEEALKIKESGQAAEVVVVTIGPEEAATQLRYGMAMGADSAILVKCATAVDSDLASRILAQVYTRGGYGLVVLGKQAIDSDAGQTGQLLAARLNLPQACFASKVVVEAESALVTREVDGGLESIRIRRPCVITTDLRLNTPRYASLPGIMKAKKKPLEEIPVESLGLDLAPKVKVVRMSSPPKRQAGRKVDSVESLVKALQEEAKVL